MMKSNVVFHAAILLASMTSYGALTNIDYVKEDWRLVWDGKPVTSLSRNEKTYFYCHFESSLGRRMSANIEVCASPANAIKYPGAVQAIEPTEYGNCTFWITRTDYSVAFDDIKRVFSINVGSSSGSGSSTVYHQIEKPSMSLTPGTTNIWIHWGIRRQNDNGPIWMKVYRGQMTNEQQRLDELPYQEIYAEYDLSNKLAEFYTGGGWNVYWSDTSVKLGVTCAYYVQVGGQGGWARRGKKAVLRGHDEGQAEALHDFGRDAHALRKDGLYDGILLPQGDRQEVPYGRRLLRKEEQELRI